MSALFQPFRLKDVELRNRIAVSPMCQYSSIDGFANDWHLVHLGSRAVGGAGLVTVEATAVSPEGRISPGDMGLWSDDHIEPLARVSRFVKEHGAVAGIQIAHAGRKASANRPWEGDDHLEPGEGAWETIAPSPVPFGGQLPQVPRAMTKQDVARIQRCFVDSAKRALEAGFQWLELHFAHGYLAHSFYSPISNKRTDDYGGSLENRMRFQIETLSAVREVWPARLPLTARVSVDDFAPGGVTVDESIELISRLGKLGLDLVDVSHGFSTPDVSGVPWGPGFMVPSAGKIRRATGLPTAVGWMITEPKQAEAVVAGGNADLVMLARAMLADAYWPFHAAEALGVPTPQRIFPIQYAHWLKRSRHGEAT
jgi:2,4-dienoyl-CoA reductase-like NADH-dependent reductase (Old Yellow Enzyme family)